ncbi:MAG: dihydropteroate synthase [Candidatus Magnetomorum sp.]|nr:dihydropteroate synthase [Candidatus Magnetomorum sp.]
MKSYALAWQQYHLKLGFPPMIMGILNVTPDSFSDGGQFFNPEMAIKHAQQMIAHGADIIDIGGESTRPFAAPVSSDQEIQRVVPVISALSKSITIPISIDTSKAVVADAAIQAGASIINDISSLKDPDMAMVARQAGVPVILMHMQGTPQTMQVAPKYENIIEEIFHELNYYIEKAVHAGIKKEMIIVDPGIGFGKTVGDNFAIIQHLARFQDLDVPLLIGSSRKSFIRKTLEKYHPNFLDEPNAIECGTQATVAVSALNGAQIVRVHNVFQTKITLTLLRAIQND